MSKKIMLLALAAISATMFVLPAGASAAQNHLSSTPGFTVAGGAGSLSTTTGETIHCQSVTGNGVFTTTTTGTVNLTFGNDCIATTIFGNVTCTSTNPVEPAGSISSTPNLVFHLITIGAGGANDPNGILITPPAGSTQFAHFSCAGIQKTVEGNIIGTMSTACNAADNTATLTFGITAHGAQVHTNYTGTTYRLTSGGNNAAINTSATITYNGGAKPKLTCT